MALLHNDVFDNGLGSLKTTVNNDITENLYICSTLPTTFTEASVTYKVGTKAAPQVATPSERTGGGREVVVAAINDGVVNTNGGSAGYYALTDDSASKLLAAGALSSAQTVYTANPFTLAAFAIGIPDPA